jgi:hypothetical protein
MKNKVGRPKGGNQDNLILSGYKFCSKCKNKYPLSKFTKDKRRPLGVSMYCKICAKEARDMTKSKYKEPVKIAINTAKTIEWFRYNKHHIAKRAESRMRVDL